MVACIKQYLLKSEEYNISSEKGAMEDENSFIRKQFL
jgi:hypothetical protein